MNRPIHLALVIALATVAGVGCGKKESAPTDIPVPSGTAAPVASGPADPGTATPPVAPPPVATTPVAHASIDACCAALSAIEHSGKEKATKMKAAMAAKVCPGIASRVKAGQVPRSEALAQILSAMSGATAPGECH
jgi:hypothetical protein